MANEDIVENRYSIISQITAEREKQVSKWGGPEKDIINSPADFVLYITHYATKWFKGGIPPHQTKDFRENMIKVAALAIAAIEAHDYIED